MAALMPINLVAHITIFFGSGYALIHARNMPRWHLIPLWWVGLASLFAVISIILGVLMGDAFVLSYASNGFLVETIVNVALAVLSGTMLWHVAWSDIKGKQMRTTGSSAGDAGTPEPPPAVRQSPPRKRARATARKPTA
jgi:hypothetical protein